MRILVITKRQYMSKDLLGDRYGRFFEIPAELNRLGHEVRGIALSYRRRDTGCWRIEGNRGGEVAWQSRNLGFMGPLGLMAHARFLEQTIGDDLPEIVWACSDAFHAILGHWLRARLGVPVVVDLYDNFESFGATRIPGVLPLFRRACQRVDGLSCISRPLLGKAASEYGGRHPPLLLENAIRDDYFRPMDRVVCRQALGLPKEARLIGTAGALTPDRGIEDLFTAFRILSRAYPDLRLVVAGPRRGALNLDAAAGELDFGELPFEKVPLLLNSLDVGVVCNRESEFGRFCFPQKFYEMLACGVPVVAANVGAMGLLLDRQPQVLYEPGVPQSLADAIRRQLIAPTQVPLTVPTWADQADRLSAYLERVVCA